ncbi:MAG TPA: type II toxin-antitoxin system VapB family antitoxin [Terriglobales bacterium]
MRIDSETDRLIEEAMEFGEYGTKEDLVTAALKEYIQQCKDVKDNPLPRERKRRTPPRQR